MTKFADLDHIEKVLLAGLEDELERVAVKELVAELKLRRVPTVQTTNFEYTPEGRLIVALKLATGEEILVLGPEKDRQPGLYWDVVTNRATATMPQPTDVEFQKVLEKVYKSARKSLLEVPGMTLTGTPKE